MSADLERPGVLARGVVELARMRYRAVPRHLRRTVLEMGQLPQGLMAQADTEVILTQDVKAAMQRAGRRPHGRTAPHSRPASDLVVGEHADDLRTDPPTT